MSNALSMSGFSSYGSESLKRMSVDADFFKSYLKTQGRLYKFPTAVALEFYSQMSNVQFVGTEVQWKNLGYNIRQEQNGLEFIDRNGNVHTLYEVSQLENVEQLPKSWQITSQNKDYVKEKLCEMYSISTENDMSILKIMLNSKVTDEDAINCRRILNIPTELQQTFYRSYANALALVCAGRLEVNNSMAYNINIDTEYFKTLSENEMFMFLSFVKKSAKTYLDTLEKIIGDYNKQRRIENEIHRLDSSNNRAEEEYTINGVSDRSSDRAFDELTDKIDNRVQQGKTADRTDNDTEDIENGENYNNAVLERRGELGESAIDNALRSESDGRNIQFDSGDTERTIDRGRTDRVLRNTVDGNDGERISGGNRSADVSEQVSDSSEGSGQDGRGISGIAGGKVQEGESETTRQLRSDSPVGEREADAERYSDERESSDAVLDSDTGRLSLSEKDFEKVVREAFDEAFSKHSDKIVVSKERGRVLYDRLANQVINNHIESSIITNAFKSRQDFSKTYGTLSKLNATYFGHNLNEIEKEIEDNIRIKTENILNDKTTKSQNAVITADSYRVELARELPNSLLAIPLEDAVSNELLSRAREKGYYFTGRILTPNAVVDVAQANKYFEIVTNGEYFNIFGVNVDNGYNIKTIEVSQLLTAEEIEIMQTVTSNSFAELKRAKLIEEEQLLEIPNELVKKEELIPSEDELTSIPSEFRDKFDTVYAKDYTNHGSIRLANDDDGFVYVKTSEWTAYLEKFLESYDYKKNPPTVKCEWSESSAFTEGKEYSLAEFDSIMEQADRTFIEGKQEVLRRCGSFENIRDDADFQFLGYDKTSFELNIEGLGTFSERQDIGDGYGGVIDCLSHYSCYETLIPMLRECVEYQRTVTRIEIPEEITRQSNTEIHDVDTNEALENELTNDTFDSVTIYQLKDEHEDHAFETLERLKQNGEKPLGSNAYNKIYTEDLERHKGITIDETLDNIWNRFNVDCPKDFTGHSLSVSDVVVIKENNLETAYYVDRHGFAEIPHFFSNEIAKRTENEIEDSKRSVDDIAIGDRYLLKDIYGEYEATVTNMSGVYPDDVGITRDYGTYSTTKNIDKFKLHREGVFLGNQSIVQEENTTETTVEKADISTDEKVTDRIDDSISVEPTVDFDIEQPKRIGNSYTHRLYKLFVEQFPDIASGKHTYERYGKGYVEDGDNDSYEPLSIENLGENRYSFMYWYVQNGDLMRDPDFEFILDHEKQELIIQEYQLDGSFMGTVYERTYNENGLYDKKLLNSLSENFLQVLKNNALSERKLTKYTNKDGEEVVVNDKLDEEPPVIVENDENELHKLNEIFANDVSAECREALNEFAEKHKLGELNLKPPAYSRNTNWQIFEKFPDGSEVNVLYIRSDKPFNNDTLRKELEEHTIDVVTKSLLENALEKNNGERNPMPVVQKLPSISYAENPLEKFEDNINALKELKRLEEATANGHTLYKIEDENNEYYGFDDIALNPTITKNTSDEILRKYSGWGGLSQIVDERFKQYEDKRNELKSLVTEQEYKQILRSTLTAFYTPQNVIDAMYKAVTNMNMPMDSRILEPSCATGNFFSRLPSRYRHSEITGVEIDATTSKIAKYLNNHKENVTILNMGFEKTNFDNNSFDLVIGNVPFSENKMIDLEYQKDLRIHDAFFRKAIDKVREGGIVAFITTSGTLDKKNPKVREMFAEKADLVGAIRLPNNVFGGTGVTSDIIFLQKRETPLDALAPKPDWCYVVPVEMDKEGSGEKVTEYINSYFANNPKMILGKMEQTSFQDRKTCVPFENANLTEQLDEAVNSISAVFKVEEKEKKMKAREKLEAWGKNFTYQVKDEKVYYRRNNDMEEVIPKVTKAKVKTAIEEIKALIELRDITRELVNKQSTNIKDEELTLLRNSLNKKYDEFVDKYQTHLSSPDIKKLFDDDIDYPLLKSLEDKNEKEIDEKTVVEYSKSPIFFKRTVNPNNEIKSVNSEEEALQVSLNMKGNVNIPYMALLMKHMFENNSTEEVSKIICESMLEKGLIFIDPSKKVMGKEFSGIVDRADYLSGNVRRKLAIAEDMASKEPELYNRNVEALISVIPETIQAEDISARMGITWVDGEDYEQFLFELSERSEHQRADHRVKYIPALGSFEINNTGKGQWLNLNEKGIYGISSEWNMYRIADDMMNQRAMKVYFKDNDGKRVSLDYESTKAVNSCAEKIQKAFKEWLFKTPERREKYVERYNNIHNAIVGRKYDGSNLSINGMNNGISLRPYQLDCIARTVYGGNTLAAHVVGAGKSAVMFSSIMKKKQLGLINRACVVVPKALVEQTADEWRKFYPDAKLLTINAKDIGDEKKRMLFSSKVATGNFDGVIMSLEQFDKIPCTPEFKQEHKQKQIDELEMYLKIEMEKEGNESVSVKKIQKQIEKYEKELDKLYTERSKARSKDNLLYFEELGFDYLVVDEAHNYKNGHFFTKMQHLAGVSSSETGRSADMHMKTDYLNETYGNGHILFATGTPVTNSMQELYTMTRYLRPDILRDSNTHFFDNWASTFGEIVTKDVQSLSGKLEPKSSFARFTNLPELMGMYKEFADIQSQKKLKLARPNIKGNKPTIITVEASKEQKEYIQLIAERAKVLRNTRTPVIRNNGKQDGMCVLSQEARLLGLGNKVIKALYEREQVEMPYDFEENEPSKVDACINKITEVYNSRNAVGDDKAVQLVFSDIAVNGGDGKFSVYEYIKQQLIDNGIPKDEIIFAPKADAKDKADIFKKINSGKYRVVIASTGTLGTGANIQENLYALHHLDIPYRPSDFEQREGRILRFGNKHDEVEIFNYVTKGTFDSMFYESVLNKARFISQILDDENPARVCEDADEKVLTYGEIIAVSQDNKELNTLYELENKLTELKIAYSRYQGDTIDIRREMQKNIQQRDLVEKRLAQLKIDKQNAPTELKIITTEGKELKETKDINIYLSGLIDNVNNATKMNQNSSFKIGNFTVTYLQPLNDIDTAKLQVKGELAYSIEVSMNRSTGEVDTTLSHKLRTLFEKGLDKRIVEQQELFDNSNSYIEQAKIRIEKPFDDLDLLKKTENDVDELKKKIYESQTEEFKNPSEEIADENDSINDADEGMTL